MKLTTSSVKSSAKTTMSYNIAADLPPVLLSNNKQIPHRARMPTHHQSFIQNRKENTSYLSKLIGQESFSQAIGKIKCSW